MPVKMATIGKSEIRKDGWAKVSGAALYAGDIPVENCCVGLVLRSVHHHARILEIDLRAAKSIPGVQAVITAEDIPGKRFHGPLVQDQPVLAIDVVRHYGEPIALVVAENRAAGEKALEAIQVAYEPLPAVFDAEAAIQPGAPKVHPAGNLLCEYDVEDGDLVAGFAQSEIILEEEFYLPRVSPAYLEAEASLAYFDEEGSLTLAVSSQKPFDDRKHIAETLAIPFEQVRVKSAVVGGAFGGKEDSELHILAGLAAWITRRPVRILNSRWESFVAHPKRHPASLHCRLGSRQDGSLMALEVTVYLDTGAYASYGTAVFRGDARFRQPAGAFCH